MNITVKQDEDECWSECHLCNREFGFCKLSPDVRCPECYDEDEFKHRIPEQCPLRVEDVNIAITGPSSSFLGELQSKADKYDYYKDAFQEFYVNIIRGLLND